MMVGSTSTATTAPSSVTGTKQPYNASAAASANTGLLLQAEGYQSTAVAAADAGTTYNPAAAAEGSDQQLLDYAGVSATQGSTQASATVQGATYDPASVSEASASQLFARLGYASTTPAAPLFGAGSDTASTAAANYGLGQYGEVAALLGGNPSAQSVGAGLEGINLSAVA